jgi:hypothetical protein
MTNLNEEMRSTADFAISSAKITYGLDLNYSEESLAVLDSILEKVGWVYTGKVAPPAENSLAYNAAIVWGSYLGEYMCLKWGGTWILNGSDRNVLITSIEFSPIKFIFQKITGHPEYSVENYINETKKVIYASVIHPQKSVYLPEDVGQPKQHVRRNLLTIPERIDKRWVYASAGLLGILLLIFIGITGYKFIRAGNSGSLAFLASNSRTSTVTHTPTFTAVALVTKTITPSATITELPTYTPKPTKTARPSLTPSKTYTQLPTSTATTTATPTFTKTPRPFWTLTTTPYNPPPPPPPPTIPMPVIVSCLVDPSIVPPNTEDYPVTFIVHFSFYVPGIGFQASNPVGRGCPADPMDTNAMAWCEGTAGKLEAGQTVTVNLISPVGSCSVRYSASTP